MSLPMLSRIGNLVPGIESMSDAIEFIKKRIVVDANGCWLWQQSVNNWGYGRTGTPVLGERGVHRISYRAFIGSIPDELRVLHKCDVPRCCNPDHLFLGTNRDNAIDMHLKGRAYVPRGEQHPHAKLNIAAVRDIRQSALTVSELSRKHGVSRRAIQFVLTGETWN